MAAFDSISEIFDEIIRNSKIKGGNILRITILFLLSDYDESVKSKFCHSLMYPDCFIATQFILLTLTLFYSILKSKRYKTGGRSMGRVFKFHNDVDTDQIIASQYLLLPNIEEMKVYTFESIDKDFAKKVKEGDIVVAGENFGCGSSREQAPSVLKALGVKAVVAKSFARIFYRNSINIGLPVIISKDLYDKVEDGADIDINLSEGWIKTENETLPCTKLPPYMQNILDHGGLINFLNEGEE